MNREALAKVAARMVRIENAIVSQDENIKAAKADGRDSAVAAHKAARAELNFELIGISETLHDLGFRHEEPRSILAGHYFANHIQFAVARNADEPNLAIEDVLERLIELAPGAEL